ncbi:MAG: hypothetical protein MJ080_05070 [Clostridia bacterium]|nr:hypothetical protein [Clostridia bacterium]
MMTDFVKKLQNLPKEYRPLPFWSWNDKLEKEELISQISAMKESGIGLKNYIALRRRFL